MFKGIKYSSNNYDEHIVDEGNFPNLIYNLKLSEEEDILITNAGSFTCLDNHYFYKNADGSVSNSLDHIYREAELGEILSTMSFASQNDHFAEKRLDFLSIQGSFYSYKNLKLHMLASSRAPHKSQREKTSIY